MGVGMQLHEEIGVVILIAEVVVDLPAYKFLYRLPIGVAFDHFFFYLLHLRLFLFLWKFSKTLELLLLG